MVLAQNKNLVDLNLFNNQYITDRGVSALAASTSLTSLTLSGVTDIGAAALANSTSLTHLDLSLSEISDEGAIALSHNQLLTQLNLIMNHVGDKGVMALAQNSKISSLAVYSAFNDPNQLSKDSAMALAKDKYLHELHIALTDEAGMLALATTDHINTLIMQNVTDAVIIALANNNHLTQLYTSLQNDVDEKSLLAFANNKSLKKLCIDYDLNRTLSAPAVHAIASIPTLTVLDLPKIDDAAMLELATNKHIQFLFSQFSSMSDTTAKEFSKNKSILDLVVDGELSSDAIISLLKMPSLQYGDLPVYRPSNAVLQAMVDNKSLRGVRLWGAHLNDDGVAILAQGKQFGYLDLIGNDIHDAGALRLAQNNYGALDLYCNRIGDVGIAALEANLNIVYLEDGHQRTDSPTLKSSAMQQKLSSKKSSHLAGYCRYQLAMDGEANDFCKYAEIENHQK